MKIKEITFEMGNDFAAVMECEHCHSTQKLSSGYHDNFYHTRVIPAMTCKTCGKTRDGIVPETANNTARSLWPNDQAMLRHGDPK